MYSLMNRLNDMEVIQDKSSTVNLTPYNSCNKRKFASENFLTLINTNFAIEFASLMRLRLRGVLNVKGSALYTHPLTPSLIKEGGLCSVQHSLS